MLAMFPNDTQEDDCATSDEELMSLHGDSDDENLKRSTAFNPSRDLEDPKFKFALNMIFNMISSGQLSSEQWPKMGIKEPLSPIYKAQPGRPKKLRKRGIDETTQKESYSRKLTLLKASRKSRKKKCGSCEKLGHNSRKYPILMGSNHSEVQQQQVHQQVQKEGLYTPSNAIEVSSTIIDNALSMQSSSSFITEQNVNQLNQPRVPREQLRSSAFILKEISEHSREDSLAFP
ncbi:hypothetical protein HAX54_018129 [Datura stramonium]|uniref:Uncharacterized protein n=1 Tax=Datura stramonium TaxID=4076 RepID=A0ABS8UPK8_DATST|nr:hypothetical protein [Datura stramonium]